jgi:hypothetical protein
MFFPDVPAITNIIRIVTHPFRQFGFFKRNDFMASAAFGTPHIFWRRRETYTAAFDADNLFHLSIYLS